VLKLLLNDAGKMLFSIVTKNSAVRQINLLFSRPEEETRERKKSRADMVKQPERGYNSGEMKSRSGGTEWQTRRGCASREAGRSKPKGE